MRPPDLHRALAPADLNSYHRDPLKALSRHFAGRPGQTLHFSSVGKGSGQFDHRGRPQRDDHPSSGRLLIWPGPSRRPPRLRSLAAPGGDPFTGAAVGEDGPTTGAFPPSGSTRSRSSGRATAGNPRQRSSTSLSLSTLACCRKSRGCFVITTQACGKPAIYSTSSGSSSHMNAPGTVGPSVRNPGLRWISAQKSSMPEISPASRSCPR
jgi:hypothetical protein